MFTPLFTPSTKYAVQQKEKQPCKYLQSHYPIPQKIIHQSLHHSPIYKHIAQQYTRKKTQPIIWCREDMHTAKNSTWVDLGQEKKDEEGKWLRFCKNNTVEAYKSHTESIDTRKYTTMYRTLEVIIIKTTNNYQIISLKCVFLHWSFFIVIYFAYLCNTIKVTTTDIQKV